MPILPNPRHEAFAQALAKGKTQVEAYAEAGYKPNESHASRLVSNGKVADRVAELQRSAAEETVFTIADMVRQVDEDRTFAREQGQAAAAHSASMGKAKLLGLLVERQQVDVHHHFHDMTDEELDRELQNLFLTEQSQQDQTAH